MQKKLNPGTWVLFWEYSGRAIQWIPSWQGLDGFQKSLCPCALDESSFSIGRINTISTIKRLNGFQRYLRLWDLDESSLSIGRVESMRYGQYMPPFFGNSPYPNKVMHEVLMNVMVNPWHMFVNRLKFYRWCKLLFMGFSHFPVFFSSFCIGQISNQQHKG